MASNIDISELTQGLGSEVEFIGLPTKPVVFDGQPESGSLGAGFIGQSSAQGLFAAVRANFIQSLTVMQYSSPGGSFLGMDEFGGLGVYSARDTDEKRFMELAVRWQEDTAASSSITEISMHPAYQQIIGMGRRALPFILAELKKAPHHWFWALRAITGENPVKPAHRGNLQAMAEDWLDWAEQKSLPLYE